MLGLLVILLISWGLLHLFEKMNLNALGLFPSVKRLSQYATGFVLMVIILLSLIGIETYVKSIQWQQQEVNFGTLGKAFIYHLRSALTEDLVFRGALLYILIQRLGPKWAIWISALVFGCYHIFSYGITHERPIVLIYVTVITGFAGYVWALAFHKTKSIYLGLGFHVGYNLLMSCFYESQPYGEILFSELSSVELSESAESWYSIFRGLYPAVLNLIGLLLLLKSGVWNKPEAQ